ncbi:MAG: (Fe-S)-binding protein [Candidatus Hodarchaeota archaeon]
MMNKKGENKITEFNPKEKFKHLAKLGEMVLQCISCGDCREQTDYTGDPPKWGVCVAKENTPGFEPYFARGKMQIIRSLWQGKLDLSKDMAEVIYQCPTCNACADACAYDMDNAAFYEALRAELVDAGCGLEAHVPMNKAMVELLNPYQRDNKEKKDWLGKLDFKVKDANTEKADFVYFVGCTAAISPEIQTVAINTAKVLNKLGIDFSVFGEHEICCGSVGIRTGDLSVFNSVATKNYELFKKSGVKTIITSCAGCYRTLKTDYTDYLEDLDIKVLHTIELVRNIINEKNIHLNHLGITATYHDPCHTGRNSGLKEGVNPLYEEPREILSKVANLIEMKTIKQSTKCCGAGGGVKKGFPELALEIAKARVQEAEETGAEYLVSICPFCYRNLYDAIQLLNSEIKMVDLMELIDQALN